MTLDFDLLGELAARSCRDQALRKVVPYEPGARKPLAVVEADNGRWFRKVVEARGWPGRSLVGGEGSNHAWWFAQQAADLTFQQHCLELLREAVAAGEAAPSHAAFLEDRVLIRQGRGQRYGTEIRLDADGRPVSLEIDDPAGVDERRRTVGLGTVAEYLEECVRLSEELSPGS